MRLDQQVSSRRINELNEWDEAWVTLHIRHRTLEPEAITELMGIEPDEVIRKGESLTGDDCRFEVPADNHIWMLSSEEKVKAKYFKEQAHLNWVLNQISGHLPTLKYIQQSGGSTDVYLHSSSWSRLAHLELEPETMMTLARYRLPLKMDFYYENSDEDY